MIFFKRRIAVAVCVLCFFSLWATDTFRVRKTETAEISAAAPKSQKISLGFNDALVVRVSGDSSFIQGVELEIKIPQILLNYKNSIAYSLYKDISPKPSAKEIDYTGNRLFVDTLPPRLSLIAQIPLIKQHKIKTSPYAILLPLYELGTDNTVFFRLQPVMKGLPDNIENLIFEVDVKAVFLDEGLLDLQVTFPGGEGKAFSVFLDELPVKFESKPLRLSAGVHHLAIISEYYRNEVRTVTIEQAKTSVVEITLKDIAPRVIFTIPEGAQAFFDDKEVSPGQFLTVAAGDHTLRFVVGDYEVIKSLTAVAGKEYTISLLVDMQILETP